MKNKSEAPKKDRAKEVSSSNSKRQPSQPPQKPTAGKGAAGTGPAQAKAAAPPSPREAKDRSRKRLASAEQLTAAKPAARAQQHGTRFAAQVDAKPAAKTSARAAAKPAVKTSVAAAANTSRPVKPSPKTKARQERPAREELKPALKSGQAVELHIEKVNDEGFGVAHLEGTRVLVSGGLPGETLVARITYVGRRETFANVIKFLKSSPDRTPSPACSMGRACDGCGLIQMRYPAQLAWKKELVTRHIARYPALSAAEVHDTIGSPRDIGYRNTAKLVVAGKHSDPVIGIYRRNTHDVLEIENCALHHPLINKVVKAAKAGIKKGKVPIYNPKSEMGLLRYLVVRVAEPSDQVMVVFVTTDQGYNEMHHLAKFIQKEVPEVAVVAQNINTSTGNVIFGNRERFVTKAHTLKALVGDKVFHLSPHSFFQVNSGTARIIYEKVRDWAQLSGEERVLDVYCGIGGISLYLADRAEEVVGIEYVEAAVADATINAALNRAENCRFEAGDAVHLVEEMAEEGGADLVVLNPPRKGCDEKVLKSVAAMGPEKIIYVSCSPETLARDLDILSRLGYRTIEVQPVDMFPQTVHVENVARIVKVEG